MKYIIESMDGFQRVFPHGHEITLNDGWFCISDENNIRWEFNIRYHTIDKIYEKGDWEFIGNTDKLLVQRGIERLKKIYPNDSFETPSVKRYDGNHWYTAVYKWGTPISYKIIL